MHWYNFTVIYFSLLNDKNENKQIQKLGKEWLQEKLKEVCNNK